MLDLKRMAATVAALGMLSAAATGVASAQAGWPERNVTVIVPWAAGGGADALGRVIFTDMQERLGKSFLLDFRPGAAATIGAAIVAKAPADGYTIMFTSDSPMVLANFNPNAAYNPMTDLTPVGQLTYAPEMIAARADAPFNTFQEMIDYAKKNPGKVSAGFPGIGSFGHRNVVYTQYKTGAQFNLVPYTGSAPMRTDLMGGTLDWGVGDPAGFLAGAQSGKMKLIAVMSDKRHPIVPNLPTTDESEFKGVYGGSWFGVIVPAGTPRPIIDKINAELRATVAKPEIEKKLKDLGQNILTSSPDEFAEKIKGQVAIIKELVDKKIFTIQ